MKKKNKTIAKRILSLFILLMMLFSYSCSNSGNETNTGIDASDTFQITSDYVIVRPHEADEDEIKALQIINRGIKSALGISCTLETDYVKKNEEIKPHQFEILIGQTNRPQSSELEAGLGLNDYTYEIINENVIVIIGGSPKATLNAARRFLYDFFGYEESDDLKEVVSQGSPSPLPLSKKITYHHQYPVKDIKIGEYSIKDFTIVSKFGKNETVDYLIETFGSLCGQVLPVVSPDKFQGDGPAIFLGCGNKNGKHLDEFFDNYIYYIKVSDLSSAPGIIIDALTAAAAAEATKRFVDDFLSVTPQDGIIEIAANNELISDYAFGNDDNGLVFVENNISPVREGISYNEVLFKDRNGNPVRVYALTIKKGSASFYVGTPNDGEIIPYKSATVLSEIKSAVVNGKNIIAGTNGDFFRISEDSMPRGLCVKEGVIYSHPQNRPWFGFTYDGKPVIEPATSFTKYSESLRSGVGGSNIVLYNGGVYDVDLGSSFGNTRHPRTAVGFDNSGNVVLLVVDGRRPSHSNGASLVDLVTIFKYFSCTNAINLDGGGSSTFVLKDAGGEFTVRNNPSDNSQRKIQSSLLVLVP